MGRPQKLVAAATFDIRVGFVCEHCLSRLFLLILRNRLNATPIYLYLKRVEIDDRLTCTVSPTVRHIPKASLD